MVDFKEYTWSEVRDVIIQTESELGSIIDEWDPGKEYTFIELSYPFGAHVLDIGKDGFQIPLSDGTTAPLNDPRIPAQLKNKLGYNSLPLGILTGTGGVEIYHKLNDRVFSLVYFTEGLNLGIWETFAPPVPFSVVSGARSLIMAPKITDVNSHRKLQEHFKIRQPVPRNVFDQWPIFVEIAQHSSKPWVTKILFLNNKWLEPKKKNIGWLNFYNFLQKRAWQHTEYARTKSLFEVNWKQFCSLLENRGERFDPYLIETLRHVIFIGQGALPSFVAVGENNMYGPVQFLMNTYIEIYGLKNYAPTFLAPAHYGKTFKTPVPLYYSFQNPTLLESVPKIKTFSSAVDDMRNFKVLMEYFSEEIVNNKLRFENLHLIETLKNIKFEYFHSEMHTYGGIHPASQLVNDDKNLCFVPPGHEPKKFSDRGSFFRCCLRMMPKNDHS